MSLKERARRYFESLQDTICRELERVDGQAAFREDRWRQEPEEGRLSKGGGSTRVLAGGSVFEKAGVNTSAVSGRLSDKLAAQMNVSPRDFFAAGISLVVHPASPMVPTVHMNLRYIELKCDAEGKDSSEPAQGSEKDVSADEGHDASTGGRAKNAWFGGGADLTPYYLFKEDAVHFHRTYKTVCDRHDPGYYARFKKWCDDYFFIRHRGETRGIGGLFFDYLDQDLAGTFAFIRDVGDAFLDSYLPIVERRREESWSDREREWQLVRRGRYVEFNLVYDRGTLFGLETQGRTESILISLPPRVSWPYDHRPEPGSLEQELLDALRTPVAWV